MKRRVVCFLLMILCVVGLIFQVHELENRTGSLYITGVFDEGQRKRFQSMLGADTLVTAYGSYDRADWSLLQDEHERRYVEASTLSIWGDYLPAYAIHMLSGRFLQSQDQGKAVLCADQASTLFCTYDCVGRTVLIDGIPYEVIGVYKPSGLIAEFSRLGRSECFLSTPQPQDQWIITIVTGKETHREFTYAETLSRLGVQDVTVIPLFRSRKMILFAICIQCFILICITAAALWQRLCPIMALSHPSIQRWIVLLLRLLSGLGFIYVLSFFPLNPSYLPLNFTFEAIGQKMRELLILWNNRTIAPTMEGSYLNWLTYMVCTLSGCFWVALAICLRKRGNGRA